jgi:hypothetical protein
MNDIVERLRQDARANGGEVLSWEQLSAMELEAADEIERLRDDIERMHADMSADIHWRAKEIGRLRSLLREVHDAAPYLGADINRRVREALGDAHHD